VTEKDCTGLYSELQTAQESLVEMKIHCHICDDLIKKDDKICVHIKEKEYPNPVCHKKCREDLLEQKVKKEKKDGLALEEESERLALERFAQKNSITMREIESMSPSQKKAFVDELYRIRAEDDEEEERQRLEEEEMDRKLMLEIDSDREAENPGYPVTDVTGIEESLYKEREKQQEDAERKLLDRQVDWRYDPPTEKQLAALEYYGHRGPKPRTKGEASDLIKKYKGED
jgi:hypothetical protein